MSLRLSAEAYAVTGVENNQVDAESNYVMNERIHCCQWTMTASRGYPVMKKIVRKAIAALRETAERNNIRTANLDPSDDEVIQIIGPSNWHTLIMEAISQAIMVNDI